MSTAEEVRKRAMERVGETRRRTGEDEESEGKRRRSGTDTLNYLREKHGGEKDLRERELELRREEMELRRAEFELGREDQMAEREQRRAEHGHMAEVVRGMQRQQQQQQDLLATLVQQQQQQGQAMLALMGQLIKK